MGGQDGAQGQGRRWRAVAAAARRALRPAGRVAVDVGLPLGVGLVLLGVVAEQRPGLPGPLVATVEVAAVASAAVLFRCRAHPRLAMVVTAAGALVVQLAAPDGLLPYAGLVALWSLAAARPPRESLLGLGALLGVTALNVRTAPSGDTGFALVLVVVVWSLGEATRSRLMASEQAARRAVAQEQARLAREVHDVVAHSLSVMVVQAAAADDVFDERPAAARTALRAVEATGRQALAELRGVLAATAATAAPGAPAGSSGDEARRPAPDLDDLDDLLAPVRALGLAVAVRREGDPGTPVPAVVGRSAYRIVQEALTNTVRHAGATRVDVLVRTGTAGVEVEVRDDGHGDGARGRRGARRAPGAGHGLRGMRERAAQLGGSLEAGPVPGGGFRVRALLPVREPS